MKSMTEVAGFSRFRSRRLGLLSLSLIVGVGAGVGAVAFRYMIEGLTRVFTGYLDYAGVAGEPNPHVSGLGRFFVVVTPVVAGILYGPLVYRFAREARGHGVPEVMLAVARNGGQIRPQVAISRRSRVRCASVAAGRSAARARSCRSGRHSDRRWLSCSISTSDASGS